MLVLSALVTVILKLTWTNVKIKTRKWNAQRWRMAKRVAIQTRVSWRFLDVVLLLSVSFHLKIILKRKKIYKQKISYFITNERSCRKEADSRTDKLTSFMK